MTISANVSSNKTVLENTCVPHVLYVDLYYFG